MHHACINMVPADASDIMKGVKWSIHTECRGRCKCNKHINPSITSTLLPLESTGLSCAARSE